MTMARLISIYHRKKREDWWLRYRTRRKSPSSKHGFWARIRSQTDSLISMFHARDAKEKAK